MHNLLEKMKRFGPGLARMTFLAVLLMIGMSGLSSARAETQIAPAPEVGYMLVSGA
jgi:hypothetical protein